MENVDQKLLSEFVDKEVIIEQTALVSRLLSEDIFTFEDIENYNHIDSMSSKVDKIITNIRKTGERIAMLLGGEDFNDLSDSIQQKITIATEKLKKYKKQLKKETSDIQEWWICSTWLTEKLKEEGECILINEYDSWWGRCESGQQIYLDSVIEKIYRKYRMDEPLSSNSISDSGVTV